MLACLPVSAPHLDNVSVITGIYLIAFGGGIPEKAVVIQENEGRTGKNSRGVCIFIFKDLFTHLYTCSKYDIAS